MAASAIGPSSSAGVARGRILVRVSIDTGTDGSEHATADRAGDAVSARTFHIRTFGCQMNEHDSERLAGALVADGLVATDDMESADVVVFNTCCIRENADNKFYGHLGNLKTLRERRPDMQIAVGGCLAQMDREKIQERAGHVDVVFGTHNLTSAPELLRRASTEGPIVEILDEPAPVGEPTAADQQTAALAAVRDLPYAAWVTIQMGCDNSCAYCIVPAVRGPEVSRPIDDLVGRGGGAGPPGRDRGHPARPERELLRPRHHQAAARSSATSCGPWARSRASVGSGSPVPTRRTYAPR